METVKNVINKIARALRLYKVFFAQFIKRLVEYRADFLTGCFGFLAGQVFNILFIFILFENIPQLAGWNLNQIMFIYGFSQIPRGFDHFFTDDLWKVAHFTVRKGEFDKYLTRPVDTLHQVLMEGFQPDALGEFLTGVILLVYASIQLKIQITVTWVLLLLVAVFGGTFIYTGVKIVFASFAFKMKRSGNLLFVAYMTSDFARYPVTIYNEFIKTTVSYIFPFAFTAYFPASYLLTGNSPWFCIGGAVVMGLFWMILGRISWNYWLTKYESAGS